MEKKSFLEKFGLIEKVENQNESVIVEAEEKNKQIINDKVNVANKENKVEFKELINNNIESDETLTKAKSKKMMSIEEIYKKYNINTQGLDSLSIVESYQKALPDYMPSDVKRQSILNILESSNVKINNLINDGNDKLKGLEDFSNSFISDSNEIISKIENEIKKLNEQINNYNNAIENMKNLQTQQEFSVNYEIEKIKDILQFINYGK